MTIIYFFIKMCEMYFFENLKTGVKQSQINDCFWRPMGGGGGERW